MKMTILNREDTNDNNNNNDNCIINIINVDKIRALVNLSDNQNIVFNSDGLSYLYDGSFKEGKLIGNVNTEGLHVNKDLKNIVNRNLPTCSISIRLFNGEVVKSDFNLNQTLRQIYYYVQNISGSRNFYLLEGFPPKPLREYMRTIQELKLENTILTQKLNES